ncbi:MAG: octaprenyl diphosphate synthase [Burkholderiaceae bacterium]|nr:octaprenyl diphosphate synthase [Burkholderiaceae bacterium]
MAAVDLVIRRRLTSEVALIGQVAEYIIQSGGKRVRPALLLMITGAISAHLQKTISPSGLLDADRCRIMAAVVEFIHTATLLHDDVVDESGLRRGRPTAHVLFGNAASVLVGDFLYSRAFQMMVEVGSSEVMAVMAESTNIISEGEVLQLMNCQDPDVTEDRYLTVIRFKTAKLFEAAAKVPPVLAGLDPALIEGCAAYGRHLGTAFQLIDDALDYAGDEAEIGKRVGDDLREGKPTLPLIHVVATGTAEERQLIRDAIVQPDQADFDKVIAAIHRTGAMQYTLDCAQRECELAAAALGPLIDSEYKSALLELLEFVIKRRG